MSPTSLRPGPGDDPRAWTRAVFAAADYAGVAMYGDPSTWQFHAARALLLGDTPSLQALADCREPEARLHLAAARWIHGDEARARRDLATIDLDHARRFAALLDQPRIRVLAQLPWVDGAMTDLGGGIRHDHRFEVRGIGPRTGDVRNVPYLDVREAMTDGFVPDFYVATMVEWHHLPPNLQALPCPRFGNLADHDLHIQTIRPWLDLFDELCVTDRTEWLDVQGLGRGPTTSFPKIFGLPANLAPIPTGPRHLDFFVSGTMLDPYHPDKARVLHELLGMPGIDLRVVRGFTGQLTFHALLAASKASFTFVRRPGAMPTRGLESVALGCAVALQEESSLRLWLGHEHGVVPYGANRGDLAAAVRTILDHHDHFGPAALRGAERVRAEFAQSVVSSQYFRFLAFRAAMPRLRAAPLDTSQWTQKRLCISRTWLPDDPAVRRRTMQANFRRLGERFRARPEPSALVDMAREVLCEFVHYDRKKMVEADERALLADAIGLLDKCVQKWPDHLAARFLLVRTWWHHGDATQRMRALQLAHDTIEGDPTRWRIGPHDDVMPFDFHERCFNHRDWFDLVAKAEKGGTVRPVELARPILAALAGYVARKTGKVALHEFAVANDPGFARWRLDLAEALLRRDGPTDRDRALTHLAELADGSGEFQAAARTLLRAVGTARARQLLSPTTLRALERMDLATIDTTVQVKDLFGVERRAPRLAANAVEAPAEAAPAATLAVLVPATSPGQELNDLLADLESQTIARRSELVLALPPEAIAAVQRGLAGRSFASVRVVTVPATAPWADRLTACALATTVPLLTVAMPGDSLRPDAWELLAAELDAAPQAMLAFGPEGWTAAPRTRFEPAACLGFSCPPPAAHRHLATQNGIGAHPMWRRALHDRHGGFDAAYGAAAEYEFWLRALADADAVQLHTLLVTSPVRAAWRPWRDAAADPAAAARARQRHVPDSATLPFTPLRPLPANLLAPGLWSEATSHARLGILPPAQEADVRDAESFLGTALLHGDTATALCLLRAAGAQFPDLLSVPLVHAQLLDALALPGSRDVLLAARGREPYRAVLARRLAELGVPTVDPVPELLPCPT